MIHLPRVSVVAAIESNLCEWMRAWDWANSPKGQVVDDPFVFWAISGVPIVDCNGVFRADFANETESRIDAALEPFRQERMPMCWWIGPSSRPADLGERLQSHGLVHVGNPPGMAVDLGESARDTRRSIDLQIEVVTDRAGLHDWTRVAGKGFGFPETLIDDLATASVGALREGSGLRLYLGFLKGVVVATAALVLGADSAGVYAVVTVPEARRRGIGATLTARALSDARDRGYRFAILQSSAQGYNVYRSLGFDEFFKFGLYEWVPELENRDS